MSAALQQDHLPALDKVSEEQMAMMLLSTYARWISSQSDWNEIAKLQIGPKLAPTDAPLRRSADTQPPTTSSTPHARTAAMPSGLLGRR